MSKKPINPDFGRNIPPAEGPIEKLIAMGKPRLRCPRCGHSFEAPKFPETPLVNVVSQGSIILCPNCGINVSKITP